MRRFSVTRMALASVVCVAYLVGVAPGARAQEALNIRVQANEQVLRLSNPNAFDLGDCYIAVNSDYKTQGVAIARGGSNEVWLSELRTSNDLRFDARLERLRRVYVSCRKPSYADASFALQ